MGLEGNLNYDPTWGVTRWTRAARLDPPLVVFPLTYKGIVEQYAAGVWTIYLTTSDLSGWEEPLNLVVVPGAGPFPRGFGVVPDDVPL